MDTERLPRSDRPSLDALNTLLRGELSAVETYKHALEKMDGEPEVRPALRACLRSHQQRAQRLREVVASLGGTPSESSSPRGAFVRMIESAANLLGTRAAIAVLEEGEDHGLKEYRSLVGTLDAASRKTVLEELLPGQQDTHEKLSVLKQALS